MMFVGCFSINSSHYYNIGVIYDISWIRACHLLYKIKSLIVQLYFCICCRSIFNIFACFSFSVLGSPKDLVTKDVTESSFAVFWTAAPGNVRHYRVTWKSLFSDEAGEKTVPGDVTTTVLEGLTPETRYTVSVYAAYGLGEGEPLVGVETTDGKSIPTHIMLPAKEQHTFPPTPSLRGAPHSELTSGHAKKWSYIILNGQNRGNFEFVSYCKLWLYFQTFCIYMFLYELLVWVSVIWLSKV